MSQVSENSALRKVVQSKYFWMSLGLMTASSMIFYDWYRDRYAKPEVRYERIQVDWQLSTMRMFKIRKAFLEEMEQGLEDKTASNLVKKSSLKMIPSNVVKVPNGTETGVFYTLDWGGSNYRVLKIEFKGKNQKTISKETRIKISEEFQKTDNKDKLFKHLVLVLKDHIQQCDPDRLKKFS
ncbi:hexokinase [Reticulomyxa filosa]|uniref:Phosphotransferase n=1 Tax=Reticulomyxa filosa TaxID=46433 RepID=X6MX96_RETFI|nr:hexokinase [Reticulomyxa filosa]|eukprot:ETO18650.1 hexokinase [Reticulomyxa filosa]